MKKILLSLAIIGSVLGFGQKAVAAARDCDSNAIMWCGAYTKDEFIWKMVGGDSKNSAANLQAIYSAYGISQEEMKLAVDGSVTKSGNVIVNGKTIATGAKSTGREYKPGSEKRHGVWLRPTKESFNSESLEAFVYTKDGVFQWAVIKSCGNTVVATPVTKPAPQPQPQPTPVVPQEVPETPAPAPAPVLPEAGMEAPLAAALGTTSLGYGLRGYLRSKKQLRTALRHK